MLRTSPRCRRVAGVDIDGGTSTPRAMTSLTGSASARTRSLSTSGRSKSMRPVPSPLIWAPVTSAPANSANTKALSTWLAVCSDATRRRCSASTRSLNVAAPAWRRRRAGATTGRRRSRCPVTALVPPAHSMSPMSLTCPPPPGWNADRDNNDRAGPGFDHLRLVPVEVGMLMTQIDRHGRQGRQTPASTLYVGVERPESCDRRFDAF